MTDREKAIVMAHTGICMLAGEKIDVFYQYLSELYGRPVYTHEWVKLDIKEKSKPDFLKLCKEEEPERKKGKWEQVSVSYMSEMDEESMEVIAIASMFCPQCKRYHNEVYIYGNPTYGVNFCPNCGARMEEGEADAD